MDDALSDDLAALDRAGLLRVPRTLGSPHGATAIIDGRARISLSSNDYLGLANDPRLRAALASAIEVHGVGAGASRLISGSHEAHLAAEARIAKFMAAPAALLFGSGYAANVGTLSALLDRRDIVFSDALNHASVIDGCRLSKARVEVFPHGDLGALEALLATHRDGARRAIIATDAIFSMDGDRADLPALRALADCHDAWLFVDEAHAVGVVGPGGAGLCAADGVRAEIRIGTLGKAFGVAGAFVAGSQPLVTWLRNRARSFVFSTAPPAALAAVIALAADIVAAADDERARVLGHAERMRRELRAQGYEVGGASSPIVPVMIGEAASTMTLSAALFDAGILAQGIRPPTVPEGTSRIRLTPMATHTDAQIDEVLAAFAGLRTAPAPRATP